MFHVAGCLSGPVHGGKKRSSEVVRSYEKVPRKMARTEEKEVIHLLPIKDKTGVIPQSMERGMSLRPVSVQSPSGLSKMHDSLSVCS